MPGARVNLTRCHGVFVSNSAHRELITRAGQGKCAADAATAVARTTAERRGAMHRAQRLKCAVGIGVKTCTACAGTPKSDMRHHARLLEVLRHQSHRHAHYYCVMVLTRHELD